MTDPFYASAPVTDVVEQDNIIPGIRYRMAWTAPSRPNALHGVVEDYRISVASGEIVPVSASTETEAECLIWDTDIDVSKNQCKIVSPNNYRDFDLADCGIVSNRLLLLGSELEGPTLSTVNGQTLLTLSARFEFSFETAEFAARLGMINLVQAQRSATSANGDRIVLLETGRERPPVLYLDNPSARHAVYSITDIQPRNRMQTYTFAPEIALPIIETVDAAEASSVTVLEQYHSYFMQCPELSDNAAAYWIPAYAPVTWGWSIRVERRSDGEWAITRRKLILPTTGHDGLQLPVWRGNNFDGAASVPTEG
ncbi:MAG: hypothetical protein ACU84J_08535 [Gammaproteobacteria bacterium]